MLPASLDGQLASRFARIALGHVSRQYPHKLDHVLRAAGDLREPRDLHPIFFGSFDWHSCVHGYWLLATLLRVAPDLPEAGEIRRLFDERITAANVGVEVAYLAEPMRAGFERPYGWGWMLMLTAELRRHQHDAAHWFSALSPLTDAFAARFVDFLPRATYPVRVGTHFNTAFALRLALEYAGEVGDETLRGACRAKSAAWYGGDSDCQAWEPGGDDFLSSALMEAECMRVALPDREFGVWLERFLPRIAAGQPATLFTPATVSDRSDGKIAHLDGLNLSRAWCWRSIAGALPSDDPRRPVMLAAAEAHLRASLPHVAGDYMGEHWLATFAMLALL